MKKTHVVLTGTAAVALGLSLLPDHSLTGLSNATSSGESKTDGSGKDQSSSSTSTPAESPAAGQQILADTEALQAKNVDFGAWATEKPREPDYRKLDAFQNWIGRWKTADAEGREALREEGAKLAQERREEFKALIASNPQIALEMAVPRVVRQDLPQEIVVQLEKPVSATGNYDVYKGLSAPGQPSLEEHTLRYFEAEGMSYKARVYGEMEPVMSRKNIPLRGVAVDRELAVAESPVRSLEVGERITAGTVVEETCPVSGETTEAVATGQAVTEDTPIVEVGESVIALCNGSHVTVLDEKYRTLVQAAGPGGAAFFMDAFPGTSSRAIGNFRALYIRATYPDQMAQPNTEEDALNDLENSARFYLENSYGKMTMTSTVTPLITLPQTLKWYQDKDLEVNGLGVLQTQARAEARKLGYDSTQYDCIILRVSGGLRNGSSWGGGDSVWLGWGGMGVMNHECGHSLGLGHANYWSTTDGTPYGNGSNQEYGNGFDVMGSGSSNFSHHYNSAFKRNLGWLSNTQLHLPKGSGVYRIFAFDQPRLEEGKRYGLQVSKDSNIAYNIEYHITNPTIANQALVLYGNRLIDTTQGSSGGKNDAGIQVGRTFSDWEGDMHFTLLGINNTTPPSIDVAYNRGPFPGNIAPTLALAASATTVNVGDTVTFTATANDANGDPLSYYWEFDDGTSAANSAVVTKTFTSAAQVTAMVTVSDMKGGTTRRHVVINVGAHGKQSVTGNITVAGQPMANVRVSITGGKFAYTDADGNYALSGVTAGSQTLTATLNGYTLTPSFTNPLTVAAGTNTANWTAAGSTFVTLTKTGDPTEGGANGGFLLTRTGDTSADLVVSVSPVGGTATKTTDYTFTPDFVTNGSYREFTIPAGQSSLAISVAAVNDTAQEGPESITMQLASNAGYLATTANAAVMTVVDNDTTLPQVAVTAPDPYAVENGGDDGSFVFTRTGSTAAALNISVAWTGTATNGTDYTTLPTTVTIPAGQSSVTVPVAVINESAIEVPEDVIVTINSNAAYVRDTAATTATVTISDDDEAVVTVAALDANAAETGSDSGVFLVTRTGDTSAPLTVYYGLSGSAFHGTDFAKLNGEVVIPAGAISAPVVITPYDDDLAEGVETVTLAVTTFNNAYSIGQNYQATLDIADSTELPLVSVRAGAAGVEGGANSTLVFRATGAGSGNVTVNYTVGGTATPGTDYTALTGTVSVPINGTNDVTVTIPITNDTDAEPTETVVAKITPNAAYKLYNDGSAEAVIRDNDSGGERVMVSAYNSSATEAGSVVGNFYISRAVGTTGDLTVNYNVSGTATSGTDYTGLSGSAVIPDGASGVVVPFTPVDDVIAEGTETVTLTLAETAGYSVDRPASATLEIADNEAPSITVGFQLTSQLMSEQSGANGEYRDIPVVLSAASATPITVQYTSGGGSATGDDVDWSYVDAANGNVIIPGGTLTFAPGVTSQNVRIRVKSDGVSEVPETVVLELRAPNNASLNTGSNKHTIWLMETPSAPQSVTEERWAGTSVYSGQTWSSSQPNYTGVLPGFGTNQSVGSAFSRRLIAQIVAPTTGSYTFWVCGDDNARLYLSTTSSAAQKTQIAYTTSWTGYQDWDKYTTQKSAVINLVAGQSYYMEAQQSDGSSGNLCVGWQGPGFSRRLLDLNVNDSGPRFVRMAVNATSRKEADGSEPLLMVMLDRPAGTTPVTVNYTVSGTATAGSDYTLAPGTLTFATDEQVKLLPLNLIADAQNEAPETIVVALTSPSGASLTVPSSHVITLNDDNAPTVASAALDARIDQPASAVLGTLSATAVSGRSITGWSIVSGDPNGVFGTTSSGQVTLQTPSLLGTPGTIYNLTVRAIDNLGSAADCQVVVTVRNTDGVWTNLAGGAWPTTGNWSGGWLAYGPDATADFSTLDITAAATVALGSDRTIGNLLFDDTGASSDQAWTLSGATLTLAGSNGSQIRTNTNATISSVIAGSNRINKTGTAALTLSGVNTFTGGIDVQQGRVNVTNASSLGSGSILANSRYGTSYSSGGTPFLAITDTGTETVSNPIVMANAGSTSYYAIQKSGAGSSLTLSGVISGGSSNMVLQLDTPNSGDSTTQYTLSGNNTFSGQLRLNRGVVTLTNANAAGTASIMLQSNANSSGNLRFSNGFTLANDIIVNTNGNNISTNANQVVLTGVVSGGSTWSKVGTGTLVLAGNNTFTGATTVSAGTLSVTGSVANAPVTVNSSATLTGTGTMGGAVTVASGGTLAPGSGGIGTLTVNQNVSLAGTTQIEIGKNGALVSSDQLNGVSQLTYGGTLTVTKVGSGTLAAGDIFPIFGATTYTGSFAAINLPALSGGLLWDTSKLAVNGTIRIGSVPVAVNDLASVAEDSSVSIPVLANDSDADQGVIAIQSVTQGVHGVVAIAGNLVTYTPAANWNGTDSFSYMVTDNQDGTSTANVTVMVNNVNDAPGFGSLANADATEDSAFSGNVASAANDIDAGDTLTFSKVSGPAWLNVASNGVLSGTPSNNDVGVSNFTVRVTDGAGAFAESTLQITVVNVNDAPVFAVNPINGSDAAENSAYSGSLAGAASDVDAGDTITYAKVSGPAWLNVAANGGLSGAPGSSDVGAGSFTVRASDGNGGTVDATLNIAVVATTGNGVWANLAGGSWLTAANWSGGIIANGADKTADFNTLNITANPTVTLDGARTIGNLVFGDTTSSHAWTLNAGSGGALTLDVTSGKPAITVNQQTANLNVVLAGNKGFTKNGGGDLVISGANTYTGGTTIAAGFIRLGNTAGNTVLGVDPITFTGSATLANGTSGSATVKNLANAVVINSGVTARFDGGWKDLTLSGAISGSGNLAQNSTGLLVLANDNTYSGTTTTLTSSSTLQVGNGGTTGSLGSGAVSLASGSTLKLNRSNTYSIANVISGSGGLNQAGTGTTVLSATNTYTGATVVSAGTLRVNGSLAGGTVTVGNTAALTGTGTLGGTTNVQSGGTLAPGSSGIGTLTVNNALTLAGTAQMEIGKTGATRNADKVSGISTLTYGGVLVVTHLGPDALAVGDSFQLFAATTYTGSFTSVTLPTLAGGLVWDMTRLAVDGTIAVGSIPGAVADSATVAEDGSVSIAVLANDTDADNDVLAIQSVTQGAHGAVSIVGNNVTYTPAANWSGTDSFGYTVTDNQDGTATATVTVTVNAVNDAPSFGSLANANVNEDEAFSGNVSGAASDIDAGDTLTFSKASGPSWLNVASNGALSGTPLNGNVGANNFVIRVTDGTGATADSPLSITVANVNDAPTFGTLANANANEDAAFSTSVAGAADDVDAGDTLTFSKVSGPSWLNVASNGTVSGTPTQNEVGSHSLVIRVTDSSNATADSSLTVIVAATNDAPVFTIDPIAGAGATEGSAYSGSIAGSATDVDPSDTLTYSKVSGPSWLTVASNGSLSGTPMLGTSGSNSFIVRVTDAVGATDDAILTIQVTKPAGSGDADGDGFTNALEEALGTDPYNSSSTPDPIYASLKAWWRMNDGSGTVATDTTGAAQNGTLINSPTWSSGVENGALTFDGADDKVDLGYGPTMTGNTDFTASAWVKLNAGAGASAIISQREAGGSGYLGEYVLWTKANGTVEFFVYNNSVYQFDITSTQAINDGKWHHVAAVRSGTNGYLYIDGVLAGQGSGTIRSLLNLKVYVGYDGRDNNKFLNGQLDDVRLYTRAVSATEAGQMYSQYALPLPWANATVGTGALTGTSQYTNGKYTVSGSGVLGGTADQAHNVYQTLSGDGEIVAKISSLQNTGTSAAVGVTVRDSLASNAAHVFVGTDGAGTYRWSSRSTAGGSTTSNTGSAGTPGSQWVKIVRSGDTFTVSTSADSTAWSTLGSTSVTMASNCYIGLSVSSGSTTTINTSQFTNVSVTP